MQQPSKVIGLRSLPRKQVVLTMAGVLLAMFLGSLDQTIVSAAMPRIVADLSGFSQYAWVTTAYIIASAVVIPITGKLTDMYGRKPFYIAGLVIFTLASVLSGFSQNMLQLILFRGLQGIGAGIMMSNAFTVIGDLFPPAQRGKYQGIVSSVFGLSAVIGPVLGGFLTDHYSWNWIFFINVPLGLAVIVLFAFFFPDFRPERTPHRVDYAGMATLALGVVSLLVALSWGGTEYAWLSWQVAGLLAVAMVLLLLFLRIENRSPEPVIPPSLMKNRIVAVSEAAVFLTAFGLFGTIMFVPLFFQGVLGATATASGSYFIAMTLGQVSGAFISGQLLSRAGGHYRVLGAVGIAMSGSGMLLMSLMSPATSFGVATFNIVLTGVGIGITMPLYTIAVQNAVPYSVLGVATSSVPFTRSVGGSIGLAVLGATLTGRFAAEFGARVSVEVRGILSPAQLAGLAQNPQALVSPEARAELMRLLVEASPAQAQGYFDELSAVLSNSLSAALVWVFLIGAGAMVLALVVHLFIREIPLRREHAVEYCQED
jgi:EmrB/QacA subfamily drug resistance transporter